MAEKSEAKNGFSIRMGIIGVLALLLIVFALMNLQTVPVRPFGEKPVIMVILVSFLLGAVIGFLVRRPHSAKRDGA